MVHQVEGSAKYIVPNELGAICVFGFTSAPNVTVEVNTEIGSTVNVGNLPAAGSCK